MARIYYRTSLFLYTIEETENTPIIHFWRATVYTFWKPAAKESLWGIIEDVADQTATEPLDRIAFEEEQVPPDESKGLGFYWVDVSESEQQGPKLLYEERTVEIVHLPTWEKTHTRRGYELLTVWRGVAAAIRDTAAFFRREFA